MFLVLGEVRWRFPGVLNVCGKNVLPSRSSLFQVGQECAKRETLAFENATGFDSFSVTFAGVKGLMEPNY